MRRHRVHLRQSAQLLEEQRAEQGLARRRLHRAAASRNTHRVAAASEFLNRKVQPQPEPARQPAPLQDHALPSDASFGAFRSKAAERRAAADQRTLGKTPVVRVRGRPTQSKVDADQTCAFVGFNTVCAVGARCPKGAKVYYEVEIVKCVGVVQLGWLGAVQETDVESGDGVGDNGGGVEGAAGGSGCGGCGG